MNKNNKSGSHKIFKCPYHGCNNTYLVRNKLLIHLRTHYGIKPFVCAYCSKSFNDKGNLNIHLRIHTGECPFKCPQCNKVFKTKGQIKEHMASHVPDKPFQCPHCLKFFKRKGVLKTHMQIHENDQKYLIKKQLYVKILNQKYSKNSHCGNMSYKFYNSNNDSKNTTPSITPVVEEAKSHKDMSILSLDQSFSNAENDSENFEKINNSCIDEEDKQLEIIEKNEEKNKEENEICENKIFNLFEDSFEQKDEEFLFYSKSDNNNDFCFKKNFNELDDLNSIGYFNSFNEANQNNNVGSSEDYKKFSYFNYI